MMQEHKFTERQVWLHNLRRYMNQYHMVDDLLNEGDNNPQANSERHLILAQYSIVLLFAFLEEWNFNFVDEQVIDFKKAMKPLINGITQYKDITKIRSGLIAHPRLHRSKGGGALLLKDNVDLDVPVNIEDMTFVNYLFAALNIVIGDVFANDFKQSVANSGGLRRTQIKPRFNNEEEIENAVKSALVECGIDVSKVKFHKQYDSHRHNDLV